MGWRCSHYFVIAYIYIYHLHKLRAVGITGNIGIWLFHFLTDISHCVRLPGGIPPCVGSKRHSLQVVELSQQSQAAVQIVSNPPTRFTVIFGQASHADPLDGWRWSEVLCFC